MGRGYDYFHLSTLPRLHQIVWCRIPEGDGMTPGSTVRPALVRATKRDTANGRGAVNVSYGTTRLDVMNRAHCDLIIQNHARLEALDLPHAVRFNLDLDNLLPWASEFFAAPAHSLYMVAGSLDADEIAYFRDCLKHRGIIQAL